MKDDLERLRGMAIFAGVAPGELAPVVALMEEVEFKKGETLFEEGERGDAMYVIVSGAVRVMKGDGRGARHERTLAVLEAGAVLGEMALVLNQPRSATAVATASGRSYRIGRARFSRLLRQHQAGACKMIFNLTKMLCARIHHINNTMVGLEERAERKPGSLSSADAASLRERFFKQGFVV